MKHFTDRRKTIPNSWLQRIQKLNAGRPLSPAISQAYSDYLVANYGSHEVLNQKIFTHPSVNKALIRAANQVDDQGFGYDRKNRVASKIEGLQLADDPDSIQTVRNMLHSKNSADVSAAVTILQKSEGRLPTSLVHELNTVAKETQDEKLREQISETQRTLKSAKAATVQGRVSSQCVLNALKALEP